MTGVLFSATLIFTFLRFIERFFAWCGTFSTSWNNFVEQFVRRGTISWNICFVVEQPGPARLWNIFASWNIFVEHFWRRGTFADFKIFLAHEVGISVGVSLPATTARPILKTSCATSAKGFELQSFFVFCEHLIQNLSGNTVVLFGGEPREIHLF